MKSDGRCNANTDGARVPGTRSAVLYRKACRAWPLKGYRHCVHHLTADERAMRRAETS